MSKILRIKNGFNNTLKWNPKKLQDYNYVDLKINVIFNNPNKTESQIVEIQFLLDFLLHAKKLGHKYYGIKRKDIQVHSVSNIVYNTYNNDVKYKNKIVSFIYNNDINQLSKHLFIRPNCILSMICKNKYGKEIVPLLHHILSNSTLLKAELLFLDCLFHFGEILLNEKKPENCNIERYNTDDGYTNTIDKLYIQKYLNFGYGSDPYISESSFVKYTSMRL